MMCFDERNWKIDDISDLAQLCEDFVLVEHIGIPDRFYNYIGPHFIEFTKDKGMPFFNSRDVVKKPEDVTIEAISEIDQIDETMLRDTSEADKAIGQMETLYKKLSKHISGRNSLRLEAKRQLETLKIKKLQLESVNATIEAGSLVDKFDIGTSDSTSSLDDTICEMEALIDESSKQISEFRSLRSETNNRLKKWINLKKRQLELADKFSFHEINYPNDFFCDVFGDNKERPSLRNDISALSFVENCICGNGLPISLTTRFQPFRERMGQNNLSKRILKEIVGEIGVDSIRALSRPQSHPMPPIFALVISRCKRRSDFIRVLCEMREEFEDLRKETGKMNIAIQSDISIKEKLNIIQRIDLIKSISVINSKEDGIQSFVSRTWDIVKSNGLNISTIFKFADSVIKHGSDSVAVGGLYKYMEISSLYSSIRGVHGKLNALFGDIS